MADIDKKAIPAPYRCNWCGEYLHDRYGRGIFKDYKKRIFCSWYCLSTLRDAEENDNES